MKKHTIALAILSAAWLCLAVPVTHADIGGNIPGPGLCDYPGVGSSGNVMGGNWFYCDFPTEINGSHWHCAYGIFVLGGLGGNGPNFGATLGLQIGGGGGNCYWACPDMTQAEQPNPPGAWKNKITPEKCKTVGDVPTILGPELSPPPAPHPEPLDDQLPPAVTNPGTPNPLTTENPN
jgi:hypothetical protein